MSHGRMLVLLVGMIATAVILQAMFDSSDHTKSERIVKAYRGAGGASIAERLATEAPGGAWSSEITHGCRGYVRVRYDVAGGGTWVFDYDVPRHRIHPGNPAAERLLSSIPPGPPGPPPSE